MKLPTAKTTENAPDSQQELSIALTNDGKIYLNAQESTLPQVQAAMTQHAAKNSGTPVIIKGDQSVELQRVVQVMDMAKQAGLPKVTVGTQLPDS
jgi:biopolymer transport protein ExbD